VHRLFVEDRQDRAADGTAPGALAAVATAGAMGAVAATIVIVPVIAVVMFVVFEMSLSMVSHRPAFAVSV
jgi:hypothetical protein